MNESVRYRDGPDVEEYTMTHLGLAANGGNELVEALDEYRMMAIAREHRDGFQADLRLS